MALYPGDACPFCWHSPNIQNEEGGLSLFSIGKLINFRGGNLDIDCTCTICKINYTKALCCEHCQIGQPCHLHYASVFNGSQCENTPRDIHFLYMRNSPYNRNWQNRPKNIGVWYANQCNSYSQAIGLLKRFTFSPDVNYKLCFLSTRNRVEFWKGFYEICLEHFSGQELVAQAISSFYNTLIHKL
tara:strand:- start:461 stop:1018 length:558 start_codon:yes stop_codon:yes gene_type:complete